jgi:hypothetical protein
MQKSLLLNYVMKFAAVILFFPICYYANSQQIAQQVADSFFNSSVINPAYVKTHPKIGLDDEHYTAFGNNFRMAGFIKLLRNDGYQIIPDTSNLFTPNSLEEYDILVIGGALGTNKPNSIVQAFSSSEMNAIYDWIYQGGSLLLLTDHPPFDTSAFMLIQKLGGRSGIGIVRDTVNYFSVGIEGDEYKVDLIFSNDNGGLGNHPILSGRGEKERIHKVLTQGGSSVTGPPGSINILNFSKYAENTKHRSGYGPSPLQSAQMIAYKLGKGRIVISADATLFSAQKVTMKDGLKFDLGMSQTAFDNRQLVLNIMHWLSHILEK